MFERALSLRRKILRALKAQFRPGKSSSLPRKPVAVISNTSDTEILGLEPVGDGVPQVLYNNVRPADVLSSEDHTAPEIDANSPRELILKTPLSIVVPPKTPVPIAAQTPLDTPVSRGGGRESRPNTSLALAQEFGTQVEEFHEGRRRRQLHNRFSRATSMPTSMSVSDPMIKLRDSYLRIMHKMAQEEAKTNPLSPGSVPIVDSDQSHLFDYVHRRRTPADDEEEEFCRLAEAKVTPRSIQVDIVRGKICSIGVASTNTVHHFTSQPTHVLFGHADKLSAFWSRGNAMIKPMLQHIFERRKHR
ncbi:hypothetical protein R1flu_020764 [Riccia fluitans]|uniref:Uncharacterized protein n=1 Tax=Riccia fluitans TaxID=41844 RepID=A0ABD1ZMF6_9MARC